MQLIAQHLAEIIHAFRDIELRGRGQEKRRASRIELIARVNVSTISNGVVDRPFSALMRDISFTGIGLFLPAGLQEVRQFVIELPRRAEPLMVVSTARHSRALADSIFGVGAEFERIVQLNDPIFFDHAAAEKRRKIQASILG